MRLRCQNTLASPDALLSEENTWHCTQERGTQLGGYCTLVYKQKMGKQGYENHAVKSMMCWWWVSPHATCAHSQHRSLLHRKRQILHIGFVMCIRLIQQSTIKQLFCSVQVLPCIIHPYHRAARQAFPHVPVAIGHACTHVPHQAQWAHTYKETCHLCTEKGEQPQPRSAHPTRIKHTTITHKNHTQQSHTKNNTHRSSRISRVVSDQYDPPTTWACMAINMSSSDSCSLFNLSSSRCLTTSSWVNAWAQRPWAASVSDILSKSVWEGKSGFEGGCEGGV